jgi:hypothetical protein
VRALIRWCGADLRVEARAAGVDVLDAALPFGTLEPSRDEIGCGPTTKARVECELFRLSKQMVLTPIPTGGSRFMSLGQKKIADVSIDAVKRTRTLRMKGMMSFRRLGYAIAGISVALFTAGFAMASQGNGLPDGSKSGKFQLEVIAFENCPAGDYTDSERHMIAVEAKFGESDLTRNQAGKTATELTNNNASDLRRAEHAVLASFRSTNSGPDAGILSPNKADLGNGPKRAGLFDPRLLDYFWQWNTQGSAHAQFVFIPVANIVY